MSDWHCWREGFWIHLRWSRFCSLLLFFRHHILDSFSYCFLCLQQKATEDTEGAGLGGSS